MNTINPPRNSSLLYGVDIQNLSMKAYNVALHDEQLCCTTTYENFSLNTKQSQSKAPKIDHLPIMVDGIMYFGTKEEANDYVKDQIVF